MKDSLGSDPEESLSLSSQVRAALREEVAALDRAGGRDMAGDVRLGKREVNSEG